jgi:hypothetical protein
MEIVIGVSILILIFVIHTIYGVLRMISQNKLKNMLSKVDGGLVSSVIIDLNTILIQKTNGNYAIVGKNKIIELEKNIFGTLSSYQYSFNSFVVVFEKQMIIIPKKGLMRSSTEFKSIKYEDIKDVKTQTIFNSVTTTKKSGSRILRGGTASILTGGNLLATGLAAASVSKTTHTSSNYSHDQLIIILKKKKGEWFTKKEKIVFINTSDAVKLELSIKGKI